MSLSHFINGWPSFWCSHAESYSISQYTLCSSWRLYACSTMVTVSMQGHFLFLSLHRLLNWFPKQLLMQFTSSKSSQRAMAFPYDLCCVSLTLCNRAATMSPIVEVLNWFPLFRSSVASAGIFPRSSPVQFGFPADLRPNNLRGYNIVAHRRTST